MWDMLYSEQNFQTETPPSYHILFVTFVVIKTLFNYLHCYSVPHKTVILFETRFQNSFFSQSCNTSFAELAMRSSVIMQVLPASIRNLTCGFLKSRGIFSEEA